MMIRIVCSLVMFVTLLGCGNGALSRLELEQYLADPENGVTQELSKGSVTARLQYLPKDLLFAAELERAANFYQYRDSLLQTIDSLHYFRFSLSHEGKALEYSYGNNSTDALTLHTYITRELAPTLVLRSESETMSLYEAIFSPTYGASQATSWVMVFKGSPTLREDLLFTGEDLRFGLGSFSIPLVHDCISRIPFLAPPRK